MEIRTQRGRGRFAVLANQDDVVKPREPLPWGDKPRHTLRTRLLLLRRWKLAIRLEPPEGVDLHDFGRGVARAMDMRLTNSPAIGDRAIWLPGAAWGWTARLALDGALNRLPGALDDIDISAGQITAERWR